MLDFELRDRVDRRPGMVVSPKWYLDNYPREWVLVAPISKQMDLYDKHLHFLIREDRPEFTATGLRKESYVAVGYVMPFPVSEFEDIRPIGELRDPLAEELRQFLLKFFA